MYFGKESAVAAVIALSLSLAGCITTQTMPDGSTKVRITNRPNIDAPNGQTSISSPATPSYITADGTLLLVPIRDPLSSLRYLGGRFSFYCAEKIIFAAKNRSVMEKQEDTECRQDYMLHQSALKIKGKPYDKAAPALDRNEDDQVAYWHQLLHPLLEEIGATKRFEFRFSKLSHVTPAGEILVNTPVGDTGGSDTVVFISDKRYYPANLDDPDFASKIRNSNARQSGIGDWVSCTVLATVTKTVDLKNGYSYGRFQIHFTVNKIGCTAKS